MTDEPSGLKTYAIVELMGHQQIAGLVSEELVAGKPMLRVDVPDPDGGDVAFYRFYSPGALYALTPCSEDDVRRFVDYYRPRQAPVYLPETPALLAAVGEERCRVCGCTESDCSQCIEKTGEPCSWVPELYDDEEGPLCTACHAEGHPDVETRDEAAVATPVAPGAGDDEDPPF